MSATVIILPVIRAERVGVELASQQQPDSFAGDDRIFDLRYLPATTERKRRRRERREKQRASASTRVTARLPPLFPPERTPEAG